MLAKLLILSLFVSFKAKTEVLSDLVKACQNSNLKSVAKILDKEKNLSVTSSSGILE